MRETLYSLCNHFMENKTKIKKNRRWDDTELYPVCAAILADKKKILDVGSVERCGRILKRKTGVFSDFRSTAKSVTVTMLALNEKPEEKLGQAMKLYDALKGYFPQTHYLPVTAMMITELITPEESDMIAARTGHICRLMKKKSFFCIAGGDCVFAAMLSLSGLTDNQIVDEVERCCKLLIPRFGSGSEVLFLSYALAFFNGAAKEKCDKMLRMFYELKSWGYPYGASCELVIPAVLSMICTNSTDHKIAMEDIAADIMETNDFLAGQEGYGFFEEEKKRRLMHAGMLVISDYKNGACGKALNGDTGEGTVVIGKNIAIGKTNPLTAAWQIVLCAAIAESGIR